MLPRVWQQISGPALRQPWEGGGNFIQRQQDNHDWRRRGHCHQRFGTSAACQAPNNYRQVGASWAFVHDEIGYNYRMPNINAALGVAQLEQLPDRLAAKARLQARYSAALADLVGVQIFEPPGGSVSNNWLVTVLLQGDQVTQRDHLPWALNDAGLMIRPVWTLMHRLPMYEHCPRADLTQAEDMEARVLNLPSSAYLRLAMMILAISGGRADWALLEPVLALLRDDSRF